MPRHLIGDLHERINVALTVPINCLAKPQCGRATVLSSSAGKEDPVVLEL